MIIALTTPAHRYTFKALLGRVRSLRTLSYANAFHARRLPKATYLFCDLDRLSFWELELAARLFRCLSGGGARVLNDPALVKQRHALLRTLKDRGLNSFNVWLPDLGEFPDVFPVFLRTQSAHRGPLTDLLADRDAAEAALAAALREGYPRKELMFVQYCAEPNEAGLFRKLSVFKIGDALVPTLAVHETKWAAKYGEVGAAGATGYEDEHDLVVTNRYASAVAPAFAAAEVDFGRIDFAIVRGAVETYEINTNPSIKLLTEHPFPLRLQTHDIALRMMIEAFEAIDTPSRGSIAIDEPLLARQRRRDRLRPYLRWTI